VALDRKGHRLIVSGTLDQHAEVRDLVRKLNVLPKNVRIDVRFGDTGGSDRFEAGVSGGGAVIYDGQDVGGRIEVNPRLQNTTVTRSSQTTQSLLTMSGREAVLKVGESVPYLDYITTYGRRGRYVEQAAVQWQEVGSYLHIQPTVLGDGQTLRVKLTPALSGMSADGPNRVRYNELATEVVVRNGESIRIGGLNEHSDFYSKFLIGVDRGGQHRNLDIVLTPRIVEPGGP
jgi:type II secretory pathway component GspD/PulD (secretin)